jgi:hypothetical protein
MNWVTLFPDWQKESWQTLKRLLAYVRPERVNRWPNSMTDDDDDDDDDNNNNNNNNIY